LIPLSFLHVLLVDEPVLRPSVRLYQRTRRSGHAAKPGRGESDFHPHFHASIDAVVVTTLADAADAVRFAAMHAAEAARPPASARPVISTLPQSSVKQASPTFQR
jgi:hypothetical protein